jgi:hypothetical protein
MERWLAVQASWLAVTSAAAKAPGASHGTADQTYADYWFNYWRHN